MRRFLYFGKIGTAGKGVPDVSDPNRRDARDGARGILRGALVLIVVLALAGTFGQRVQPAVGKSLPGLLVMLAGLVPVAFAGKLSGSAPEEKREGRRVALKLIGVGVCAVGALMVFYM